MKIIFSRKEDKGEEEGRTHRKKLQVAKRNY